MPGRVGCARLHVCSTAFTFLIPIPPRRPQLADKDSCIGLFLVRLQRFDVMDGRGGFAILHRFERLPESR
jgi:hypothetical protein